MNCSTNLSLFLLISTFQLGAMEKLQWGQLTWQDKRDRLTHYFVEASHESTQAKLYGAGGCVFLVAAAHSFFNSCEKNQSSLSYTSPSSVALFMASISSFAAAGYHGLNGRYHYRRFVWLKKELDAEKN